jgi:hypothetical protein
VPKGLLVRSSVALMLAAAIGLATGSVVMFVGAWAVVLLLWWFSILVSPPPPPVDTSPPLLPPHLRATPDGYVDRALKPEDELWEGTG